MIMTKSKSDGIKIKEKCQHQIKEEFSFKRIWGLFYNEFSLPTFEEGTGSFVSGGPYRPIGEPPLPPQKSTKLFNTGLL